MSNIARVACCLMFLMIVSTSLNASTLYSQFVQPGDVRGQDVHGCGDFHCSRGNRRHDAIDFVVKPGAPVLSPITGKIKRIGIPYFNDDRYDLIVIESSDGLRVKLFYISPIVSKNEFVEQGDLLGYAQDITVKYPGITPHIHCETYVEGKRVNPRLL